MAARHVIANALSARREELTGEASPMDYDGARLVLSHLEKSGFSVTQLGVPSRRRLAGLIGETIWGPAVLEDDQREECYRIADAVVAAGYLIDGGAAAPPAATKGVAPPSAAVCATQTVAPPSLTGPGPVAVIGGQPGPVVPRRFDLFRHRDISGVSGTGPVAEGVRFSDGTVALRWPGADPSTAVWPSVESVLKIHGHSGATEIRWLDEEPHDHTTLDGDPQ